MLSILRVLGLTFLHLFRRKATVRYPEEKIALPARWRGRIVLTRDAGGGERCVACYLCSAACPVGCISLQAAEDASGRRFPEFFRINFSRCIFCGFCEDACPTCAIQLVPDYEMSEFDRRNMVYEKEHLLVDGEGKVPGYDFYKVAGVAVPGKSRDGGAGEEPPADLRSLLP